ncbi:hypothetical protein H6G96_31540 [Nostoc sp. FACHB-892]|uniref:hypothetical protein n=1 Tax=Nostoc sp. FACHB-892 TaxID=2692843 RepID=UPI00168459F4|nr:hypothetical protein [Nostoc sp. FACHB-892]MBD2730730.1 hypothetical protein [Nostoc sp. FACHB-892]
MHDNDSDRLPTQVLIPEKFSISDREQNHLISSGSRRVSSIGGKIPQRIFDWHL